ncbi:MAG: ferric reductase-like transmembrane domain-containing protein [Pseudomonadota bacterium]
MSKLINLILRLINSMPLFYAALLLPSWPMVADFWRHERYYPELMHETGFWSVQLLVVCLAITPLSLVAQRTGMNPAIGRWLIARRQPLGLLSFYYGALHAAFHIRYIGDVEELIYEATELDLGVGWLGLMVMLLLALTSNRLSRRWLGRGWKTLHRALYPATALIFLHWYLFDFFPDDVLIWLGVLIAAKFTHIWMRRQQARRSKPPFRAAGGYSQS